MNRLSLELSKMERAKLVTPIPYLIGPFSFIANHLGLIDVHRFVGQGAVKSKATILMYHHFWDSVKYPWRLEQTTVQDFEKQIRYLSQKYEIVPLDKLVQCIRDKMPFPPQSVAITFDDGNRDNYTQAYPILKKYDAPATIFLPSNYIDTRELYWWDKTNFIIHNTAIDMLDSSQFGKYSLRSSRDRFQAIYSIILKLNELTEKQRNLSIEKMASLLEVHIPTNLGNEHILSWDEIKEMSNNGIAFGSHSVTHPFLTKVSYKQARSQIIESKQRIEEELGQKITAFSYPHGDYNAYIREILKESGFASAVTIMSRPITHGTDLYELGRISPGWNFNTFKFNLKMYPSLKRIFNLVNLEQ